MSQQIVAMACRELFKTKVQISPQVKIKFDIF